MRFFFKTIDLKSGKKAQMKKTGSSVSFSLPARFPPASEPLRVGAEEAHKGAPTMYQMPRMMVPVRTWQHRQQLVEYHRSHGEIILVTVATWKLVHEGRRERTG